MRRDDDETDEKRVVERAGAHGFVRTLGLARAFKLGFARAFKLGFARALRMVLRRQDTKPDLQEPLSEPPWS